MLDSLTNAIVELDLQNVRSLVQKALESGIDPREILTSLTRGLEVVGDKFERKEFFLTDLIMAGETMKEALSALKPKLTAHLEAQVKGKVVLGTIQGDIHDIGKNLMESLLTSSGFEVYDLGVDVPPQQFVEKCKETGAKIIGVSALLSTTVPITAGVVEALEKAGLREKVKVIIGGAAVRPWDVEKLGVDAAVNDAVKGVRIVRSWAEADENCRESAKTM